MPVDRDHTSWLSNFKYVIEKAHFSIILPCKVLYFLFLVFINGTFSAPQGRYNHFQGQLSIVIGQLNIFKLFNFISSQSADQWSQTEEGTSVMRTEIFVFMMLFS